MKTRSIKEINRYFQEYSFGVNKNMADYNNKARNSVSCRVKIDG